MAVATVYGIPTDGKDVKEIAEKTARAAMEEFGRSEGYLRMASTAPAKRSSSRVSWPN